MEAAAAVCELIEQERALCAAMDDVLLDERQAVACFSPADVERCHREKTRLQEALVALVERRRAATRALAATVGGGADGRLASLLGRLSGRDGARLRDALGALRRQLVHTRRLQRVNAALLEGSLALLGELLHAYRQLLPGASYDARAALRPGAAAEAVSRRV
jgi:hypothetical protein